MRLNSGDGVLMMVVAKDAGIRTDVCKLLRRRIRISLLRDGRDYEDGGCEYGNL